MASPLGELALATSAAYSAAVAVDGGGGGSTPGRLHLPGLLQGWGELTAEFSHRRLQAASAPSCIGGTFTVQAGSCSVNCATAAMQVWRLLGGKKKEAVTMLPRRSRMNTAPSGSCALHGTHCKTQSVMECFQLGIPRLTLLTLLLP